MRRGRTKHPQSYSFPQIPSSFRFPTTLYTTSAQSSNLHDNHTSNIAIFHLAVGTSAHKSNPTVHNEALDNMHNSQQPDRSRTKSSKGSYALSDLSSGNNSARSPVSPIESNGETWKHPPRGDAHPEGLGTFHEVPLDEAAAPAKERLSRPFEQPYPTSKQGQGSAPPATVPMQATMTRADSHLRRQPAQASKRKAAPAPIAIPKPAAAHQSRLQRDPRSRQADQAPAQRAGRHQGNQSSAQRPVRHQGWNPLDEPPRQQGAAHAHHHDRRHDHGRSDDLEKQLGLTRSKDRSKHDDPQYYAGRRCFWFLMVFLTIVLITIIVAVEADKRKQ